MLGKKEPKYLTDREFADIIKNGPLASIDLIIRDRYDRVLLMFREDRPAKGCWFVPGGRILKYENADDAKKRIVQNEIKKAFPDLKIEPEHCRLLNIYKHEYPDNKFTDNSTMSDMKDVDTHYVSIAHEYKITNHTGEDRLSEEDKPKWKWWTINELLTSGSVHHHTKELFNNKFHTPTDSQLYSALMSHYVHYDNQFWSRTQIILALQVAAFAGAYTIRWPISAIIMIFTAVLIFLIYILINRDIRNSRVNEKVMDEIAKQMFLYAGYRRPLSLRAEPCKQYLTGQKIIAAIVISLIVVDLFISCKLWWNPNFFK